MTKKCRCGRRIWITANVLCPRCYGAALRQLADSCPEYKLYLRNHRAAMGTHLDVARTYMGQRWNFT